jgi:nitrogen fixation protein NifQ
MYAAAPLVQWQRRPAAAQDDEYEDLLALLLEYRATADAASEQLCIFVARSAMGENHLWQDMGLPNRQALSDLMRENFPTLFALNSGNMKWKKFFYRQLCERAGVPICKSPHCADCDDYAVCFGPES